MTTPCYVPSANENIHVPTPLVLAPSDRNVDSSDSMNHGSKHSDYVMEVGMGEGGFGSSCEREEHMDDQRKDNNQQQQPHPQTQPRTRPQPQPQPQVPMMQQQHLGLSRQYWRDILLGVNDGLVSTFLLVVGVTGGGMNNTKDILLTAISGSIAGAISMCAGEYVASKSQNEVLEGELRLEKDHIRTHNDDEISELDRLLPIIGIQSTMEVSAQEPASPLGEQLIEFYRNNPAALLKIMKALEFGIIDNEVRSPVAAGLVSCFLFIAGSLPSVIPFACTNDPQTGMIGAIVLTAIALLFVGAVKTWASRTGTWFRSTIENLCIASVGGGLAYVVGVLFQMIVS